MVGILDGDVNGDVLGIVDGDVDGDLLGLLDGDVDGDGVGEELYRWCRCLTNQNVDGQNCCTAKTF
jgi:hypothetical protein